MRLHEQIYTSAPRLLEGGGNLGVVAETRDFPRALSPQLTPLRAYTLLDSYDLATPASHPPRLVLGPSGDGSAYALTRTVFAGADHTGRTTPLAHHVVVDIAAARRERCDVAGFVAAVWPLLKWTWPDEPRRIDPPHDVAPAALPAAPQTWRPLLPWLAGTLADFARTGRAAVLVIDPDTAADVPAGLMAVLALLPPSLQWSMTLATHAVSVGDFLREAGLLVTYPDAPLLVQCRQRRDSRAPILFDLTRADATLTVSAGDWGDLLRVAPTPAAARRSAEQFDAFGLSAAEVPAFARASKLVDDLASAPAEAAGEDWNALAARVADVSTHPSLSRWIAEAATLAVRALADDDNSATRWQTLASVTADPAWPDATRVAAADALLDNGPGSLDAAAEVAGGLSTASAVFRPALLHRPALPQAVLAAASGGDAAAARRAAFVLSHAALSREESRPVVTSLFATPPAVRQHLLPAVIHALAAGLTDADDITALANSHADARRSIVLPVLRQRMRGTHDRYWLVLADRYRECAIAAGLLPQDYTDLFKEFGPSMRRGLDAWLNHANLTPLQQQDIRTAAERTGVITPVRPPPVPAADDSDLYAATPPEAITAGGRSRRAAVGGAGPIRVSLYVSLLVVFTCCVSAFVARGSGETRNVLHRPELFFALGGVALWAVSEVLFRLVIRAPQQLGVARWGRRFVLAVLIIAIPVAAWPTLTHWRPSLGHDLLSAVGLGGSRERGSR